jgi:ABC-2 type transport system ATP-binding protein
VLARDGGTIEDGTGREIAGRDLGERLFYLPDAIAPWPQETVGWALDFGVHFFGGAPADRVQVIADFDLDSLLDVRMGALSKGQRKRALLAFGLVVPQPLLLADEPFDGLDLRQTRQIARILRERAALGRTLLLSIHQIADAARVCDRFVLLGHGRVRAVGTFEELQTAAAPRWEGSGQPTLEEVVLALT